MKNIVISFFLVVTIFSCSKSSKPEQEIGLNNELMEIVKEYINDVDFCIDTVASTPFYSLFFFDEDKEKYLTIWASSYYPTNIGLFEDTVKYKSYQYAIVINSKSGKDKLIRYLTIFDFNKNYDLYDTCDENYKLKSQLKDLEPMVIYDGPYYARTYKYTNNNGNYSFELCDKLIIEPFDSGFVNYERLQQKEALFRFTNLLEEYDNFEIENPKDTLRLNQLRNDIRIAKIYMKKIGNSLLP